MKRNDGYANLTGSDKVSRRNFLKKSSLGALTGMLGTEELRAGEPHKRITTPLSKKEGEIGCGIIGFGPWGREIADTLGRLPEANLLAVCDNYDMMLRRAQRSVPQASRHSDYREVLDNPDIKAVFVSTPTHMHRQIAIDALQAGKNVYCEAPMASTVEDAREIALAARDASDQVFQVGHLYRSNPQHRSIFQFIRSGAVGRPTMVRTQYHTKESWRRASASAERETELNWRLDDNVSLGLIGEACLQQLDVAFWILQGLPVAITGFGQLHFWNDGRSVPDTVQAMVEFPDSVHMMMDATLTSSFDDAYEVYFGNDSTVQMRGVKAWMFKEVDAPQLGWEVYARKDQFFKETGIALMADATKLDSIGTDPTEDDPNVETPIWYALQEFMENNTFGPFPPNADYLLGYQGTVTAVRAKEAIAQNTKIMIDPSEYELS